MATKTKKVAARGFVNNKILESLLSGDKYGYEIIKEVEEKSNGGIVLKQPSLYSSLKRFESKGYITSYWGDSDIGGRRHYYTITNLGQDYYKKASTPSKYANFFDDDNFWEETDTEPEDNINKITKVINNDNNNFETERSILLTQENNDFNEKYEIKKQPLKRLKVDDIDLDNYDIFSVLESESAKIDDDKVCDSLAITKEPKIIQQQNDEILKQQSISNETEKTTILESSEITELPTLDIAKENNLKPEQMEEVNVKNIFLSSENQNTLFNQDEEIEEININTTKEEKINISIADDFQEKEKINSNIIPDQESIFEYQSLIKENFTTSENNIYDKPLPQNKINKETINTIQFDMFSENYIEPAIKEEEKINVSELKKLKESYIETEPDNIPIKHINKEIPLIKEREQGFFNWEDLKRKAIANNKSFANDEKTFHTSPISENRNTLTQDKYDTIESKKSLQYEKTNKVFDNVGYRINSYDPVSYIETKKQENVINTKQEPMFSSQEIEERKKFFNEKLDNITKEKLQANKINSIDYRNILGELLASDKVDNQAKLNNNYLENNYPVEITESKTLENVIQQSKNISYTQLSESLKADGIKFKPYNTEVEEKEKSYDFVLLNKARMQYGIIMFLFMIIETTSLFIVLNINGLIFQMDYLFYVIAYGSSVIILLITVVPFLVSPYKRNVSNYKFSYAILFGLLTCIVLLVFTYALNTFIGFTFANFNGYFTKLLLPSLISVNFVIAPLIYKLVLKNKSLY